MPQLPGGARGPAAHARRVVFFLVLSALLWTAGARPARAAPEPVQVGVWAVEGSPRALQAWSPTAEHLSRRIPNRSFTIVPLDLESLAEKVRRNTLDFIIVDPALYVQLEPESGIANLASLQMRHRGQTYTECGGTVFCLASRDDLRGTADLCHKTVVAAHNRSMADWIAVEREFQVCGMDPARALAGCRFTGDRATVLQDVLDGRADAGVLPASVLERMAAEHALDPDEVRVLAFPHPIPSTGDVPVRVSTRLYPTWVFAACPKAPPELAKDVSAALLAMSERYPDIMDRPHVAGWTFPRSNLSVHEALRDLRLPPYEHYGEISFVEVVRQHMYVFLAAGTLLIIMAIITLYVTALNRALSAEIAERKRAEVALRESVVRFEHVASCSADWIWETDAAGRFTYSSAIVEQMLGYGRGEIIGRKHFDLFARAEKERLAEAGPVTIGNGARVFRERYRLLTKDGRVVIHESTAEPIFDAGGALLGYRGVNRDITDQVRFVRLRY